jgi:CRISPR-associated protein Cas1
MELLDKTAAGEKSGNQPEPLPVRMLNEYVYCPRLFHLMFVEERWADNAFTVEGKSVHRRVDTIEHVLPNPEEAAASDTSAVTGKPGAPGQDDDEPPVVSSSVTLTSESLSLTGKLDLVSTAGDEAVPVERKRGRVPNTPERSWLPERVQLMAQGLLLREHGYRCDHGILYFAGSRTRVHVPFTGELEAATRQHLTEALAASARTTAPVPLENSPKCHGCSLAGICLPDETLTLLALQAEAAQPPEHPVRRLYPARDDALPFYVQTQGASVGKKGNTLTVKKEGEEIGAARLKDVSQLVLCGNIQVSAQTLHLLCEAGIPVVHLSSGNWFYGMTTGITLRNSYARAAQYHCAADPDRQLAFAKAIVSAKGANQRTMLRRNASPRPESTLDDMARLLDRIDRCIDKDALRGHEGSIAAAYFAEFSSMLKNPDFTGAWGFEHRNRRPPRDPVNALLSFGYAMLAKECTVALLAEGLDPYWGLYHEPRHGRPALALDLMEEFRPLIVDSALLSAVNTNMVSPRNFSTSDAGCILHDAGRKAIIQAYEARLDQLVTHPVFDYRCSWRAILRMQARLLGRWFRGEIRNYLPITTR